MATPPTWGNEATEDVEIFQSLLLLNLSILHCCSNLSTQCSISHLLPAKVCSGMLSLRWQHSTLQRNYFARKYSPGAVLPPTTAFLQLLLHKLSPLSRRNIAHSRHPFLHSIMSFLSASVRAAQGFKQVWRVSISHTIKSPLPLQHVRTSAANSINLATAGYAPGFSGDKLALLGNSFCPTDLYPGLCLNGYKRWSERH